MSGVSVRDTSTIPSLTTTMIPDELRNRPQWVVWRSELHDGKWTKVPFRAGNPQRHASSTSPATWGTFAQARAVVERGQADGLGFVFTPADSYVGIDLDDCRNPVTGDIDGWAWELIERFDSYAEASPSGAGIHIIVACTANIGQGRHPKGIGVFQSGRYFTMTGDVLDPKRAAIADCTADFHAWHGEVFGHADAQPFMPSKVNRLPLDRSDREVLDKAFASRKNGVRIRILFAGDTSDYPSHSEADLAFCRLLAFYTQDAEQLDRLVRSSGLYREKWERADYRNDRISRAIAGLTDRYDPAYRTPIRAPQPTPIPANLPDDPATLKRLLAAERLARRTEDRIVANADLGAARNVATVLYRLFAEREAAGESLHRPIPITLRWVAARAGVAPSGVSTYLKKLQAAGLIVKVYVQHPPMVHAATGEVGNPTTELRVLPSAGNAAAFAEDCACYTKPPLAPGMNGHGGVRPGAGRKRCPTHPTAPVVLVETCAECGDVLRETVVEPDPPEPDSDAPKNSSSAWDSDLDSPSDPVLDNTQSRSESHGLTPVLVPSPPGPLAARVRHLTAKAVPR